MAKITALGGVSHPEEPPVSGALDTAHEYADEVPGPAEPPDPMQDPGPGQGSTPLLSSPESSEAGSEPEEAAAAPVEPEAAAPAAGVAPPPAPKKPAPSLSRAKDAEITGSGGVVLPKPEAS